MGYYTSYSIEEVRNFLPEGEFAKYLSKGETGMSYAVNENGETANTCKWYNHDDEMIELSANYPETIFKLHGEGEESGDIWDKYYTQGKLLAYIKAKIVLEEPDMTDW